MEDNLRDAYDSVYTQTTGDNDEAMVEEENTSRDSVRINAVIIERYQEVLSQWYSICVCIAVKPL